MGTGKTCGDWGLYWLGGLSLILRGGKKELQVQLKTKQKNPTKTSYNPPLSLPSSSLTSCPHFFEYWRHNIFLLHILKFSCWLYKWAHFHSKFHYATSMIQFIPRPSVFEKSTHLWAIRTSQDIQQIIYIISQGLHLSPKHSQTYVTSSLLT